MPMKITVDLKCDNCKKTITTPTVLRRGQRRDYNAFPKLLIVKDDGEQATVRIIKGCNEFWANDDDKHCDIACSVKCAISLARKNVEKLVKSTATQGD